MQGFYLQILSVGGRFKEEQRLTLHIVGEWN
jgi:hypothetical protein